MQAGLQVILEPGLTMAERSPASPARTGRATPIRSPPGSLYRSSGLKIRLRNFSYLKHLQYTYLLLKVSGLMLRTCC